MDLTQNIVPVCDNIMYLQLQQHIIIIITSGVYLNSVIWKLWSR